MLQGTIVFGAFSVALGVTCVKSRGQVTASQALAPGVDALVMVTTLAAGTFQARTVSPAGIPR